jgi:hypothetical protein
MRYLTVSQLFVIYERVMRQSGGAIGVRDLGGAAMELFLPRNIHSPSCLILPHRLICI